MAEAIEMFQATDAPTLADMDLSELATRANGAHRAAESAIRQTLDNARMAGEYLHEAKTRVAHGEWQAWLAANFRGSLRTAQAYMRIAERWPELEPNAQNSAHLSIDGALKLLADPRETVDTDEDADGRTKDAPESEIGLAGEAAVRSAAQAVVQQEPRKCASCGGGLERADPDFGPCFSCRSLDAGKSNAELLRQMRERGAGTAAFPEDGGAPKEFRAPAAPAKPAAEPKPEPVDTGVGYEDELEERDRRIYALEAELASLRAEDRGAEIARLHDRLARLEANHRAVMTTKHEAEKEARYAKGKLAEIRTLIGVERDRDIVPRLKELVA